MMELRHLVDYLDAYVLVKCEHDANVGEEPRRETFTGTMTEMRGGGVIVGGKFIPNRIIVGVERY